MYAYMYESQLIASVYKSEQTSLRNLKEISRIYEFSKYAPQRNKAIS